MTLVVPNLYGGLTIYEHKLMKGDIDLMFVIKTRKIC